MSGLIPLSPDTIHAKVNLLIPEWSYANNCLEKTHLCSSFLEAIEMVKTIADIAEKQKHHPKITIDYTTIHFALITHDVEAITQKDFVLAQEIDNLLKK